ncbi:hypothetical protein [Methylobacterium durans]|uniref:Uncharacterized protein n=1 Tax=Methylobacterium durans TaxID=2202825 RepID=A0A2U8W208_9HYPH|nr:hypothetical protein [Methylobacterium durans]AWN40107.1 hypothetical protein DK389_05595 [Methylobacterium durans]
MNELRDFALPWRVVELEDAYRVEDANGLAIATLFFVEDPEQLDFTGRLSRHEARRVAARIVEMSDFRSVMMELEARDGAPTSMRSKH